MQAVFLTPMKMPSWWHWCFLRLSWVCWAHHLKRNRRHCLHHVMLPKRPKKNARSVVASHHDRLLHNNNSKSLTLKICLNCLPKSQSMTRKRSALQRKRCCFGLRICSTCFHFEKEWKLTVHKWWKLMICPISIMEQRKTSETLPVRRLVRHFTMYTTIAHSFRLWSCPSRSQNHSMQHRVACLLESFCATCLASLHGTPKLLLTTTASNLRGLCQSCITVKRLLRYQQKLLVQNKTFHCPLVPQKTIQSLDRRALQFPTISETTHLLLVHLHHQMLRLLQIVVNLLTLV
mmetsp:Transcript_10842/g.16240  ORF Transcript_10842/g.16240 Transcript_10842/m.16240 type:complete len:290 (-) Transcript_10842:1173-2042(-)